MFIILLPFMKTFNFSDSLHVLFLGFYRSPLLTTWFPLQNPVYVSDVNFFEEKRFIMRSTVWM